MQTFGLRQRIGQRVLAGLQWVLEDPAPAWLQAEFDTLNARHFDGKLPRVPLFIGAELNWWAPRWRRIDRATMGKFRSRPPSILLRRCIFTGTGPGASVLRTGPGPEGAGARYRIASDLLLHELVHLQQHVEGSPLNHGRRFQQLANHISARLFLELLDDEEDALSWPSSVRPERYYRPAKPGQKED